MLADIIRARASARTEIQSRCEFVEINFADAGSTGLSVMASLSLSLSLYLLVLWPDLRIPEHVGMQRAASVILSDGIFDARSPLRRDSRSHTRR